MNIERLQKLADHLRGVPPEAFDLDQWSCGSVACAVGHACLIPEFAEQGLTLKKSENRNFLEPVFGFSEGWDAVSYFFDICEEDAEHLFGAWQYLRADRHPEAVAKRIEALLGAA